MEFLGVIALIGMLIIGFAGFVFRNGANEKFSELRKELMRESSAVESAKSLVAQTERATAEIIDELRRQNASLKTLESRISALEQRPAPALSIPDSALKPLEARITALEQKQTPAPSIPDSALNPLEARITALEQKPTPASPIPDSALKPLEARIAALERRPIPSPSIPESALKNLELRIISLEQRPLPPPASADSVLNVRLISIERRLSSLEKSKVEPKIEAPPPVLKPLKISDLNIVKTDAPLFSNDPDAALKVIATIENLAPITDFLEKSSSDKKDSFVKIISKYRQNLAAFVNKLKRGKFAADAFSEEATDAFFGTLSKHFLATIPVSILRGSSEDPKFYAEFLAKVNAYLAACRVYTEPIEPGKAMNPSDIDRMSVVKKDTAAPAKDKIIDEVERLPYFINYLTGDGESERYCSEGKMIVLKFDGGSK